MKPNQRAAVLRMLKTGDLEGARIARKMPCVGNESSANLYLRILLIKKGLIKI